MENIFAPYPITMPSNYQESIKNYVSTGTKNQSRENAPFNRQIDFWYMALCLAFNKGLTGTKEKNTYNAITGEILSRNPYRIAQIQMIALTITNDETVLSSPKEMLDICINLANSGIPLLLSILDDTDASPLQNIFDELEDLCM
ncbi:hypothetical protein [Photobacterium sanguinicancri]|uniref:hypothetical protein n=1 Tax=Photobacterium sanguinicancri TaxID=875932 RepID=UPI0024807D89|nr:hypothetical protein [Photobacterium sanguinicancri]